MTMPSYCAISCPCLASLPAHGPNALGFMVVALSATLASLTLVVTSVGAGIVSMALHTPQQGAITLAVIQIHVQQPVRLTHTLSHLFTWARHVCVCAGSHIPIGTAKAAMHPHPLHTPLSFQSKPHALNNNKVQEMSIRGERM